MLRKAAAFTLACALASSVAQAAESPRIASTSLCGDSYVLALAPTQAAALSWQSRDPVSLATPQQKALPQVWDDAERLIGAGIDHVLFGPGEGGVSGRFLISAKIKTHNLQWGEDFDAVKRNYVEITKFLRTPSAQAVDGLESRLEALKMRANARPSKPRVLYLSRAGGTAGPGTYVDAAITAAGGVNVAAHPGWQTLDPEAIMSFSPDLIVTSFLKDGYESVNASGVRHKVLRNFMAARPQVNIPGALWPCAGPGLIEAAELIADGLEGLP